MSKVKKSTRIILLIFLITVFAFNFTACDMTDDIEDTQEIMIESRETDTLEILNLRESSLEIVTKGIETGKLEFKTDEGKALPETAEIEDSRVEVEELYTAPEAETLKIIAYEDEDMENNLAELSVTLKEVEMESLEISEVQTEEETPYRLDDGFLVEDFLEEDNIRELLTVDLIDESEAEDRMKLLAFLLNNEESSYVKLAGQYAPWSDYGIEGINAMEEPEGESLIDDKGIPRYREIKPFSEKLFHLKELEEIDLEDSIDVPFDTPAEEVLKLLPNETAGYLEDDFEVDLELENWRQAGDYVPEHPDSYPFQADVMIANENYEYFEIPENLTTVEKDVEIGYLEIVSLVETIEREVIYGDTFDEDLPEEVEVELSDGTTEYLSANWDEMDVPSEEPGDYNIEGEFDYLPDHITNPENINPEATVTVLDPPEFEIDIVECPDSVNLGEEINLDVEIDNLGGESLESQVAILLYADGEFEEDWIIADWQWYDKLNVTYLPESSEELEIKVETYNFDTEKFDDTDTCTVEIIELHTLDVSEEGEGDVSISPDEDEYEEGEEVTLTADPSGDYEFVGWSGDIGDADSTSSEITITMDEDKEVEALFDVPIEFHHNAFEDAALDELGKDEDERVYKSETDDVRNLYLEDDRYVFSLQDVTHFENLRELEIIDNAIGEEPVDADKPLDPLKELSDLRYLNLAANSIEDISPLSEVTSLEELILNYNNIESIAPLEFLDDLEELYVDNNNLDEIYVVSYIPSLEKLSVDDNNIEHLPPFESLEDLDFISFENNNVSSLIELEEADYLNEINFNNNDVEDISPLLEIDRLQDEDVGTKSVRMENNPLGYDYMDVIEQLEDWGVFVYY